MPRVSTLVPRTAYDAHAALGETRGRLSLDSRTRLERVAGGGVNLIYRTQFGPATIVEYFRDGRVRMTPVVEFSGAEFNRIAAALPPEWTARWRGNRRPQIVFRDVYPLPWVPTTFHPIGDITFGRGGRLTLDELNAEADVREGVHPLPSRRRNPRPLPRYLVRTAVAPDPDARARVDSAAIQRMLDELAARRYQEQVLAALDATTPDPATAYGPVESQREVAQRRANETGLPVRVAVVRQPPTAYSFIADTPTDAPSIEYDTVYPQMAHAPGTDLPTYLRRMETLTLGVGEPVTTAPEEVD